LISRLQSLAATSSSFDKINEILTFTARAQIPLTEDNVREHISFFEHLLKDINKDLSDVVIEQAAGNSAQVFDNLLNCL